MKRFLALDLASLAVASPVSGDLSAPVSLRWKAPLRVLNYATELTAPPPSDFRLDMEALAKGKLDPAGPIARLPHQLNVRGSWTTQVESSVGGTIAVRLLGLKRQTCLKADLSATGEVLTFWIESREKNLLQMLFELPSQPVRVGDTWPLHVNLVTAGQRFTVKDSARLDEARLVSLQPGPGGDTVATIDYVVVEWVKGVVGERETSMSLGFVGRGEFLIGKGAWKHFSCWMASQSGEPGIQTPEVVLVSLMPTDPSATNSTR